MKKHLILLIIFFSVLSFSQNGEVEYTIYFEKFDTKKMIQDDDMRKMYQKVLLSTKKQAKLIFSKDESLFTNQKDLSLDDDVKGAFNNLISSITNTKGTFYFNSTNNKEIREKNSFGHDFLIIKKRNKIDWKLTSETKKIGSYLCYKAYAEVIIQGAVNKGAKKEVYAWYAPEIPYNHGPGEFYGLPGLILEIGNLNDNKVYKIKATKIVVNKSNIKIRIPNKGKKVTEEELYKIGKRLMVDGAFEME